MHFPQLAPSSLMHVICRWPITVIPIGLFFWWLIVIAPPGIDPGEPASTNPAVIPMIGITAQASMDNILATKNIAGTIGWQTIAAGKNNQSVTTPYDISETTSIRTAPVSNTTKISQNFSLG